MPVVMGQLKSAPCFRARAARISLIVINLPRGTFFMMASTSRGAGITISPLPHLVVILPVTGPTLGRPLLSDNFSLQDFLGFMCKQGNTKHQDPKTKKTPNFKHRTTEDRFNRTSQADNTRVMK